MKKVCFCFLSLTILIILSTACGTGAGVQQNEQRIHQEQQVPELDPEMAIDGRTPLVSRQLITSRRNTGHGTNTRTDNADYIEYINGNRPLTRQLLQLEDVDDAEVYIQGRVVLVGVYTTEEWDDKIEKNVKETVHSAIANDAEVRVINDDKSFKEFQKQLYSLREGAPYEEGVDADNFMRDLGRILQRPFERGRVIN
ncbi:YhcN/YlaJ family sporulation lipoprotein [Alkalihalobacterium elongatum]|uniref:YhcN/YlaJ family sporulation lipoprotein n=1 Tax=Alkalihalobacterium elongatum TaxID=2675466 RepID=UPI001C1F909B|nr:YhcN/YlaJ family sporulation lipoprotein [Alkalihalobacterium elongatum]